MLLKIMVIDSLCVFCGASPGNKAIFIDAAASFGAELARHRVRLVYGGGGSGLMGCVADSVLKAGGEVTYCAHDASYGNPPTHHGYPSFTGNLFWEVIESY